MPIMPFGRTSRITINIMKIITCAMEAVSYTHLAPRVADIRAQNTALRARRAELLSQNGFEPDCLDDKPSCPDCEDRGWIGTRMCSCLKELCAQEQIKSLSSLLDLGEQSFENFSLDWYLSLIHI